MPPTPVLTILKTAVLERFLRYVQIDTQSSADSATCPSTKKQFDLARLLVAELQSLGISDARVDEHCYVTATIPATIPQSSPVIGLLAHLDTSPDVTGTRVKPRTVSCYRGGDIELCGNPPVRLSPSESPELDLAIGHCIVTSDGTTLLGADDKAGIAAIMAAAEYLVGYPEFPHPSVKIGFTPDEEIGRGADKFDLPAFGAEFAYTVDGGFSGEINDETFSADAATITVTGRDMHPGYAKRRMINSIRIAADIIASLPKHMAPETTDGRDGFIHPNAVSGGIGRSTVTLLLRDFTETGLAAQQELLRTIIADVANSYPGADIRLDITPTYRNMRGALQESPEIMTRLENAVRKAGIEPVVRPIRGGTDGSALTARGLLTPNIFTAACNAHSLTEWVDIDGLTKCAEVLIYLVMRDGSNQ